LAGQPAMPAHARAFIVDAISKYWRLMMPDLKSRRIAVLATDGVEQVELTEPAKALRMAGARVDIISPKPGSIQGMNHDERADAIPVDVELKNARPEEFDALLLPGGVANPDKLRTILEAVKFVEAFVAADKPIAAICHGPWTLINAGGVSGKRMTSWPSLQQDLINAGAIWNDEPLVTDHQLVTSRKPDDLPRFNKAMITLFAANQARRPA
jgi:protease I